MGMGVKLSIIVPVYNMAADGKLEYCMNSLVSQTLTKQGIPYEIIAVDDASTDNSLQILRGYEEKYPVKVRSLCADFISISGHKIHAPKGIGALYVRKSTKIRPLILGGKQENGLRAGTESVPLIAGFGAAVQRDVIHAHACPGDGQQAGGKFIVQQLGGPDHDAVLIGLTVGDGVVLTVKAVQAHGGNFVECLDVIHGGKPPGWSRRTTVLAEERAALAPLPPQRYHDSTSA